MDPAISVLQKAPPADLGKNKKALAEICPDSTDAVNKKYPLPFLVIDVNEPGEKPFLACRYNQVGKHYRSPWTNKLCTTENTCVETESTTTSSDNIDNNDEELALLQEQMNQVWQAYVNLYYGHTAVGSVYLSEYEKGSFQGVLCVQKECTAGSWDSLHHVQVESVNTDTKTCMYHVQSTVLNVIKASSSNNTNVSCLLSKDTSKNAKILSGSINASHMESIGKLVEANEIDLRSNIERVHVPKTVEIIDSINKKSQESSKRPTQINPLMGMMMDSDAFKKRAAKNSNNNE